MLPSIPLVLTNRRKYMSNYNEVVVRLDGSCMNFESNSKSRDDKINKLMRVMLPVPDGHWDKRAAFRYIHHFGEVSGQKLFRLPHMDRLVHLMSNSVCVERLDAYIAKGHLRFAFVAMAEVFQELYAIQASLCPKKDTAFFQRWERWKISNTKHFAYNCPFKIAEGKPMVKIFVEKSALHEAARKNGTPNAAAVRML